MSVTLSALAGDDNAGSSTKVSIEITDRSSEEITDEDCAALKESAIRAFKVVSEDPPQSVIVWVEDER